jgi:hypothetical protein
MRTALIEYSRQRRLFEENENGWRESGKEVDSWNDEVQRWEQMPKKWLAGETNPYRPRVKSMQSFPLILTNFKETEYVSQCLQWPKYKPRLPRRTLLS